MPTSAGCKAGGWLVQQVERAAQSTGTRATRQFFRQLDTLRFAAGERIGGLPQLQIP